MKCIFGELGFCKKDATHRIVRVMGDLDIEEDNRLPSYCEDHARQTIGNEKSRSWR